MKLKILGALAILAITFYTIGYTQGQASVYEKAKNDIEFQKQVWGGK
jgi:hypothetical protein